MAPVAWVKRLVTLCDRAPATPFGDIQLMLEKELGKSIGEMFERFEMDPLKSDLINQVPHTHNLLSNREKYLWVIHTITCQRND